MARPKRDSIPAESIKDYRVERRKTPILRDDQKSYIVKTEWDLTYKGELIDTFDTKRMAINYIIEKETT